MSGLHKIPEAHGLVLGQERCCTCAVHEVLGVHASIEWNVKAESFCKKSTGSGRGDKLLMMTEE